MAKNVIIRGVVYSDTPEVDIPINGGGTAKFMDTDDATLANGAQMRSGVTAYAGGVKVTGSMSEKSAQTYTPTTTDQTIAADQYLAGAQTVKGDANLVPANIVAGKSIFNVSGSAQIPVITQDSTSKILSIS